MARMRPIEVVVDAKSEVRPNRDVPILIDLHVLFSLLHT